MTLAQKYIVWGTGIVVWVFGLSILLSYLNFGYLDWPTLSRMAWMISPLLAVAGILLYLFRQPEDLEEEQRVPHVRLTVKEETR